MLASPSVGVPTSPASGHQAGHGMDLSFQNPFSEFLEFTDYPLGLPDGGFGEWELTEDFEAFLQSSQEAEPEGSRCSAPHRGSKETVESLLDQHLSSTDEPVGDLSDLCFQDLGDFSLSDMDISPAMIDYLLG